MIGTLLPVAIAAAVFFLLYRRIRRIVGRQKLSLPRLIFRITLFLGIVVLLGVLPSSSPLARALGGLLGLGLAIVSVVIARIEEVDGVWTYRTNPVIALVVVALLLGRLAYRFAVVRGFASSVVAASDGGTVQFGDPLGRGLLMMSFTYFATYYVGILIRHFRRDRS